MIDFLNYATSEDRRAEREQLATVAGIYSDGVSLIFSGENIPSQKHYLCNKSAAFTVGDTVKIASVAGTYIVEYAIGAPTV